MKKYTAYLNEYDVLMKTFNEKTSIQVDSRQEAENVAREMSHRAFDYRVASVWENISEEHGFVQHKLPHQQK